MGDPGAHLFTSPLPQPTLPTSCFSSCPPPQSSTTTPSKKNQTILDIGSCWAPLCAFPPASPGPRRVPTPPAQILSPDDSHRCAGGLTAEAIGPPLPSASQRESSPAPQRLGEAGPPRPKASGDHARFRESSCTATALRSAATRGSREGETGETSRNSNESMRFQFYSTSRSMRRGPRSARPQPFTLTLQWLEPTLEPEAFLPVPTERQDAGRDLRLLGWGI